MSGNAMVPTNSGLAAFNPSNLQELFQLAKVLAESGFFGDARQPAQTLAKILAGRELGFPVVASLVGIHIIEGKPSVGSHLLAAAIRSSGRYDYEILEHTDHVCAVRFKRLTRDGWVNLEPVERIALQQAVDKGWHLTKSGAQKPAWAKTPKNMLFARCLTNGQKFHCPDLFSGLLVYDADELEQPAEPRPVSSEAVDASYTITPPNGAQTHVGGTETVTTPPPADPTPPAPQPEEAGLSEPEYQALVKLARDHRRTKGEVQALCVALGVPTFSAERLPRARLPWIRAALTWGLVPTEHVDRISQLVEGLGLDWSTVTRRLETKYQVSSLAHLLPTQAAEVESGLLALQAKRAQPQPAAAP